MFRFGDFELEVGGRELRRDGALIHLEPQAFDVLVFLIEHRDRVVSKQEMLDGVWGHGFLSDANLTTRVKEARRAIGDDGTRQAAIKNVRGRGYRFVAPVEVVSGVRPGSVLSREALVGRDTELDAVIGLLGSSPLVTITGPGGVGKSTLARAAASEDGRLYEDGVRVVELAALDREAHVLPAVARALDIVLEGDRPDAAVRSIGLVDALLVLDNCEHVIDEVTALVDRALSVAGARIRILATSQLRLGLSVEAVVAVPPLSVEAARELFEVRARTAAPSWDDSAVATDRVDGLISGLDRLPLVVEMAAARLGSMTFGELERAIAEGAPFLQVSHRAPTRRHRSLESLVTWSAELLSPQQRRIFEDFSVFAGSVRASDAGAVVSAADPSSLVFDLASLVERSLLVADVEGAETRYSMLMTIRSVARRWHEESGAAEETRARHAEHVNDVLRSIDDLVRTPREADGRRLLDGFVDEARVAHEWAQTRRADLASEMSAAIFHAAYSSMWNEPADWSRALLARHADRDSPVLFGARLMSAAAAAHRGDLVFARETARVVAAGSRGRLRAAAVEVLADVALFEGDLEGAARAAEELRRLGDELGDSHVSTIGAVDGAIARMYSGDAAGALEDLDGTVDGELAPTDRAWLAVARGDALRMLLDPAAVATFLEAIDLASAVGNHQVVAVSRSTLALEHARSGEYELALDAYAAALHAFLRHGNYTHAVTALRTLVGLLEALGDDHGATVIAGTVFDERLEVNFGVEAGEIAQRLHDLEQRIDASRFTAWFEQGRTLDVDQCLRVAIDLVDRHRR